MLFVPRASRYKSGAGLATQLENESFMSDAPPSSAPSGSDIDHRLLIPFLVHVTLLQTFIQIIRITTSYRAIELGLPVVWLGIIATGFAIIPVFSAVQVGRWIDRGNDARAVWTGNVLIVVACLGFWLWPVSGMHLLGFSVLLGFGHMFCMAGHQMLMTRAGGPKSRESVLGYYMVAAAVGQGGGPLVVGWLGGEAAVPPTGTLFTICLATAGVALAVALTIRPMRNAAVAGRKESPVPIGALLHTRGLPAIFIASIVTITAVDLMVIYLPALGAERQIDSNHIGWLLAMRSFASLVSRLFYARMIYALGRAPLTLISMLVSAVTFGVLALPLTLPWMYAVMIVLGFGMGIASTLTLSGVMHLAPAHAYGTALTLRMTGNRIGQVLFPSLAGLVATATGVPGIFLIIGVGLGASGVAVPLSLRAIGGGET
jgi:MFS family permease